MASGTFYLEMPTTSSSATGGWEQSGSTWTLETGESGAVTLNFTAASEVELFGDLNGMYALGDLPVGFQVTTPQLALGTFIIGSNISSASVAISALSINTSLPADTISPVTVSDYAMADALGLSGSLVLTVSGGGSTSISTIDEGSAFYGTWDTNAGATTTSGFYKSDVPGIANGTNATPLILLPGPPRGYFVETPFSETAPMHGFPGHAVVFKNRFIYAAGGYTVGTDLPVIRVWNGVSDYELCKIPQDSAGNVPKAIVAMVLGNGKIYLTTWDTGTTTANVVGRVLRLDPDSGQLTNVGNINSATGHIPYSLMFHNGELWAGTHRSALTANGIIARIKPEEQTSWTTDLDLSTVSAGVYKAVISMASYKGNFYYGSVAASGNFAVVGKRTPAAVYSVSDTGPGGTASDWNGYYAMAVFGENLYASYWNPDATEISVIRKFDNSSWSTALNVAAIDDIPIIALFVDNGVLYALGVRRTSGVYEGLVLTTTNGTSWTNRTSNAPLTGGTLPDTMTSRGFTNAFGSINF
jgi:hypothetical protein